MMDFLPIILGSDENAYGCSRLIHEAYGIKSLVLCKRRLRATMHTEICNIVEINDFDRTDVFVSRLLEILKENEKSYNKIVVVPCSDYYMYLMSENYDKFEGRIANKFISPELIRQLETKDSFYELCDKYGMDYPRTIVIKKEERDSRETEDKIQNDFFIRRSS